MIFNMIGAGGELNFEVKPYSSNSLVPAAAKENTIAIITATAISGYEFSLTQPSSPENGYVWITTGTTETVAFSATKKNSVMVYPMTAKQYVNGSWNSVEAKSYIGGKWVEWWDGTLFNGGNQYTSQTGGWAANTGYYFNSDNTKAGTVTISTTIRCSAGDGRSAYAATKNKIDVSAFTSITATVTDTGTKNYELALMSSASGSMSNAVAYCSLSSGTTTLNIQNLTGSYYIVVGTAGTSSTIEVSKLKMNR